MKLLRSGLWRGAGALVLATTAANLGNYLVNLFLGRWLGPAGFSEVSLLVTLVLLLSIATTTLSLVISRFTAIAVADGSDERVADLRRSASRAALVAGIVLGGLLAIGSGALASAFQLSSPMPLVVVGVSLPAFLLLGVDRGILQGQLRFERLGATYVVEMVVRLVASVALVVAGYAAIGAAVAIALSIAAAWTVGLGAGRGLPAARGIGRDGWRLLGAAAAGAIIGLLGQTLIANSDVLVVKGSFPPAEAGTYAAVALVGRAIFFATSSLSMVMFPIVAGRARRGEPHVQLLVAAVALVMGACAVATAICFAVPGLVLGVLFGDAYAGGSALLGLCALATSCFAGAALVATYRLSLGSAGGNALLLAAGVLQLIGLLTFRETLQQVVLVQVVIAAGLLVATIVEARLAMTRDASRVRTLHPTTDPLAEPA
ncbi:MAG: oligosaccharide flippase family protein [Chloroflexota bacterium]